MSDGMGGTAAVLTREASREPSLLAANNHREPGRSSEPARSYQTAIAAAEPPGANELPLASGLHQQARLYRERGEDGKAEPLLQRALAIQEQTLGPAHPHVAITLSHLIYVYRRQGKETAATAAEARATHILAALARGPALA